MSPLWWGSDPELLCEVVRNWLDIARLINTWLELWNQSGLRTLFHSGVGLGERRWKWWLFLYPLGLLLICWGFCLWMAGLLP